LPISGPKERTAGSIWKSLERLFAVASLTTLGR